MSSSLEPASSTAEPSVEIKTEPSDAPAKPEENEANPTPWEFLTTPPDKDSLLKPRTDSPDALLSKVKVEASEVAPATDDDKAIDPEAKTFIEALDHFGDSKTAQESYFYEQNRYSEQMLFEENSLLGVASEETVTPEGRSKLKRGDMSLKAQPWTHNTFHFSLHLSIAPQWRNEHPGAESADLEECSA